MPPAPRHVIVRRIALGACVAIAALAAAFAWFRSA